MSTPHREVVRRRAYRALAHVLPPMADIRLSSGRVLVQGEPLRLRWIGDGRLSDARRALNPDAEPLQVAAARRMSPGARKALAEASIGWVDETGAAEIAIGTLVVSKDGRAKAQPRQSSRWSRSALAVAEALLCGMNATVADAKRATGLSTGGCTNALRFLSNRDLLVADAPRGRRSARRIADQDLFLHSYAAAVRDAGPPLVVTVGVIWRDPVSGLAKVGREWDAAGLAWACTGTVAASILAPHLTSVGTTDIYVDVDTVAGLEAAAAEVGLQPIEGGRLNLRPFPTVTSRLLSVEKEHLRVAPWPRVYADLQLIGVRGEEAAEHLREVMHAG